MIAIMPIPKNSQVGEAKFCRFNSLLEKGIIVRQLDSYNLPNCLRITIGTKDEMNKTISVLKGIM